MKKPIYFVLLLAIFIRLISIDQSLWLDEAINVNAVRDNDWYTLIFNYSLADFHPPLYHVVLKTWGAVFGWSEISMRLPSVLFSVATTYLLYLITLKSTKNQTIALLSSLLLVTSGLSVYYAQEARMYAQAGFFASLAVFLCLKVGNQKQKFLERLQKSPKRIIKKPMLSLLTILSISAMVYTDYVVWLLLPVLFYLAPLLSVIGFLTITPWLPFLFKQLSIGLQTAADYPQWNQVVGGFSVKTVVLVPIKFIIGRVSIDNNLIFAATLVPILLLTLWLVFRSQRKRKKSSLLFLAWLSLPPFLATIISFKISILSYFRLLYALPALYALLVIGVFSYKNMKVRKLLIFSLLAINTISTGSYLIHNKFHREDWKSAIAHIESHQPETSLALIPSLAQAQPFYYYSKNTEIYDSLDFQELPDNIFVFRYLPEIFDPSESLISGIDQLGYIKSEEKSYSQLVVWHYIKNTKTYAQKTF